MNEHVQIVLIVVTSLVVVVGIALWIFKDRIDFFSFTASNKSVTAKMEQRQNTGITISGNSQCGKNHEITAEAANSTIENNHQKGHDHLIRAATTSKKS